MSCYFCGEPILEPKTSYTQITGWERMAGIRPSGKQGGSDIYLREPTGEVACETCITKLRAGVALEQESLL